MKDIIKTLNEKVSVPGNDLKAKQMTEQILLKEPNNTKALVIICVYYFMLADDATTRAIKIKYYDFAEHYARKAIAIDGKTADAHFFLGSCIGRCVELKGTLFALRNAKKGMREIEKTIEIDPNLTGDFDIRAKAVLGAYYATLPSFLGGSIEKAEKILNESMTLYPHLTLNYIELARVYIKQGKKEEVRKLLRQMLEVKEPYDKVDFVLYDMRDARILLEEIEGHNK